MSPPDEPEDSWDGHVPWPGNTYLILDKATGRAITLSNNTITIQDLTPSSNPSNKWHCVESNGYFGFLHPATGRYLGHDGKSHVHALADKMQAWECMTPRKHPEGGYQLLVPFWWETLRVISVAEDGESLVTRQHGTTLWEFVKVPEV